MLLGYSEVFESYAGIIYNSSNKDDLGNLALKCLIQEAIFYIVLIGLYQNLSYTFFLLGNDKDTPFYNEGITFLRWDCISAYLFICNHIFIKYLSIQGYFKECLFVSAISLPVLGFLGWLVVVKLGFRTVGLVAFKIVGLSVVLVF